MCRRGLSVRTVHCSSLDKEAQKDGPLVDDRRLAEVALCGKKVVGLGFQILVLVAELRGHRKRAPARESSLVVALQQLAARIDVAWLHRKKAAAVVAVVGADRSHETQMIGNSVTLWLPQLDRRVRVELDLQSRRPPTICSWHRYSFWRVHPCGN